jgi:phage tail sheath gpL-like
MAITFEDVPADIRIPFVTAEIIASLAGRGPSLLPYRALIIGQKISAGTADDNSLHRVTRVAEVITLAGRGSMLHRQALAWFESNKITEVWILVLADDSGGTAAAGDITVTGPATESGAIALYLGGERVIVSVTDEDDDTTIAAAIQAAIALKTDLPVTAAVNGGDDTIVDLTFRHKGEVGNHYNIRDSFGDTESLPAGVGLAYTQMTGGDTNPDLDDAIAAMGDGWWQIWTHPYIDSTSLTAIEAELADRFGSLRMIDGFAITAAQGSFGTLTTLGGARNSKHQSIFAQPGATPLTPPMEFAADVAANVAKEGERDPSRPMHTVPLKRTVQIKDESDLFTKQERGIGSGLLYEGIATTKNVGTAVQLEGMQTTYQTDPTGSDDASYRHIATLLTLLYLRYDFRNRFGAAHARFKLADDGTPIAPGQKVITPKRAEQWTLGWFRSHLGRHVENYEQFKADMFAERNEGDPNRLDIVIPADLINQLIVTAAQIAFRR